VSDPPHRGLALLVRSYRGSCTPGHFRSAPTRASSLINRWGFRFWPQAVGVRLADDLPRSASKFAPTVLLVCLTCLVSGLPRLDASQNQSPASKAPTPSAEAQHHPRLIGAACGTGPVREGVITTDTFPVPDTQHSRTSPLPRVSYPIAQFNDEPLLILAAGRRSPACRRSAAQRQ
jgi:hypothetical protein